VAKGFQRTMVEGVVLASLSLRVVVVLVSTSAVVPDAEDVDGLFVLNHVESLSGC
jgi:hypothetical protein